ncbi:MAG: DegT/DnrJ/EryC1/StrS family aminotransferase [Armatimonadota bacterium]
MTNMTASELAINGGPKAVERLTGTVIPKIDMAEFLSVAERFGFSEAALERIKAAVSEEDMPDGGPNFARYWCPKPADKAKGPAFEALAREKFGVPYALSVSSGTGALHAAFVGVGVGPGTEVICPGLGFAATAMAVMLAGGVPVFSDVDESLQMDPAQIEQHITPRTVALAPTHHWSNVADMGPIMEIARKHNLKVVEDCAQGPGAKYRGQYVGAIGDAGCFSISAYKIIGGGEGGMVIAKDERIFDRIRQTAEAGGLWRPNRFAVPRYEGELFPGTNYRLSELEAAVDVVQLQKLDDFVRRYQAVSARVRGQLKRFAEITPQQINDAQGYIGYMLRFFPATCELSAKIAAALNAEGIGAGTRGADHQPDWHVCSDMQPINLTNGHVPGGSVYDDPRNAGASTYRPGQCPVAEDLYAREVTIGLEQWLSEEDCDHIAAGINKVLSAYCTGDASAKAWI